MKLFNKIFIIFILLLSFSLFVSCDDNKTNDKIVISFDSQGGSSVEKITLDVNDAGNFKLPDNPTKDGFLFGGWFLDQKFKREFKKIDATPSEITLYAKWINPNDLTNTGFSFSIVSEKELNIDGKIKTKQDEDDNDENLEEDNVSLKEKYKEKISVDCTLYFGKSYKIEDLNLSLVIGYEPIYHINGFPFTIGKSEYKLYIKDGVLYAYVPDYKSFTNDFKNVSVDLVKIYNDNITLIKNELKKLIEEIKNIPLEDLPEGFDLSVLDRIDIDNLKLDDLKTLIELLPDDIANQFVDIENVTIDSIFAMIEESILPEFNGKFEKEDLEKLKKYFEDIIDILKNIMPTKTKDGKTTRWEITDKQVKDVIDYLVIYLNNELDDISSLFDKLSNIFSKDIGEGSEYPIENSVLDINEVLDLYNEYKEVINNSIEIKNCYGEVTMGVLLPEKVNGLFEISVDIKGEDFPDYLDIDDYIKGDYKISLSMTSAIVSVSIEFPDFSSYEDVTDSLNMAISESLTEFFKELPLDFNETNE